jgi:hypothetical protein
MNHDLERGAGPRRFTYEELDLDTHNFSIFISCCEENIQRNKTR